MRKLSDMLSHRPSFVTSMFYEWKTTARTLLFTSKDSLCLPATRFSLKRKLAELMSSRKLVKYFLMAFVVAQIYIFAFSSSVQNLNYASEEEKIDFLRSNWNPKHSNERGIKSYGNNFDHNMVKNKFEDSHRQFSVDEIINDPVSMDKKQIFFEDEAKLDENSKMPLCPKKPPNLYGRLEFHFNSTPPTLEAVALNNPNLQKGGFYHPPNCVARSRIAFIIPHRARELHLRALLWHVHPIFQRQQLYYKVYVIHQAGNLSFNKAKLMNIGFIEAMKDDKYDCVVFHDVDLLPEDDRLLYSCIDTPKHLSVAIDKYSYRLPYTALFGGVTMLTMEQFKDVNGYSNMYWGWGGEDDDMFNRIFSRGYTIKRPPFHLARYKMSFHHRDRGNRLNLMRYEILSRSVKRMQEDGLNNVKYTITHVEETPVYTNITADVGAAVIECKPYLSQFTCNFVMWMCEHLTLSCGLLQYNSTDDGTLAIPLNTQL